MRGARHNVDFSACGLGLGSGGFSAARRTLVRFGAMTIVSRGHIRRIKGNDNLRVVSRRFRSNKEFTRPMCHEVERFPRSDRTRNATS